jgi:two-component system C4-dicarboxylate transport response regulator DctD
MPMKVNNKVFIVDDNADMQKAIIQWFELADFEVTGFSDAEELLAVLDPSFNGAIVADVKMPGMSGLELQQKVTLLDKDLPIVLVTGHGDVSMAVKAIRDGAYDFIEKPFEPDHLLDVVRRACEKRYLILENRDLHKKLLGDANIEQQLIGNSAVIRALRQEILEVADTDVNVMITGETGSGKEVVARCLHEYGSRKKGNFVPINCGAIPEAIFESELFGHEPGAFTGALKQRIGKIEHAGGGTLFLDEITCMPMHLQVKILRAFQEREIERLGANKLIPVDLRVVSASNIVPEKGIEEGTFRSDLYFRLNVIHLHVPPLREREDDVILLFEYFVSRAAASYDREVPALGSASISSLLSYDWPGNVRELKNTAQRYVLSSIPVQERLQAILTQTNTRLPEISANLADQLQSVERQLIEQSLKQHQGNIQEVMAALDLPRRTLNQKMVNHGLDRKNYL